MCVKQRESTSARCDEVDSLIKRDCAKVSIENPRGSLKVTENKNLTYRNKDSHEKLTPDEITRLQPQKLNLTLRSGNHTPLHLTHTHTHTHTHTRTHPHTVQTTQTN